MSETPQTEWLECPCCGESVMEKAPPALWYEDEEELCSDCGCLVAVRVDDDDDPPRAYTVVRKGCPEHGEVE